MHRSAGDCRARQVDQPARAETVVEILVPLAAERARSERGGLSGLQIGDRGIAPEPEVAEAGGTWMFVVAPSFTMKMVPLNAFSGRPPSAGGLTRRSRQCAGQAKGANGLPRPSPPSS